MTAENAVTPIPADARLDLAHAPVRQRATSRPGQRAALTADHGDCAAYASRGDPALSDGRPGGDRGAVGGPPRCPACPQRCRADAHACPAGPGESYRCGSHRRARRGVARSCNRHRRFRRRPPSSGQGHRGLRSQIQDGSDGPGSGQVDPAHVHSDGRHRAGPPRGYRTMRSSRAFLKPSRTRELRYAW